MTKPKTNPKAAPFNRPKTATPRLQTTCTISKPERALHKHCLHHWSIFGLRGRDDLISRLLHTIQSSFGPGGFSSGVVRKKRGLNLVSEQTDKFVSLSQSGMAHFACLLRTANCGLSMAETNVALVVSSTQRL